MLSSYNYFGLLSIYLMRRLENGQLNIQEGPYLRKGFKRKPLWKEVQPPGKNQRAQPIKRR
jgi:hypothetical protein